MRNGLEPVETLSSSELHDRIVLPRLIASLRRAAEDSRYWKEFFARERIDITAVRNFESFAALPLTDKAQLLADQCEHPPFGRLLAVPPQKLRRVHRTSGATETPFIVLLTARDIAFTLAAGARALRCAGVRSDDLVIHCLNYSMWSGGVTDHLCFERAGATVIPFGVGNSSYLIATIQRLRPTAISCTPSYLFRLEELCTRELRVDPATLGLRKAFLGGEGGLQEADYRTAIESRWNLAAIDANYGMSEVLSIFGAECAERGGLHFHAQGILHAELIDHSGRTVDMLPGQRGELVLTSLRREAQPLFRYRTHDLVEVQRPACACGRTGFLFKVLGRSDDMIVVKGVNFFPTSVQGIVKRYREVLSGEYRVITSGSRPEALKLVVELRTRATDESALATQLAADIRSELSISVVVEFAPPNTLLRSQDKSSSRLVRT